MLPPLESAILPPSSFSILNSMKVGEARRAWAGEALLSEGCKIYLGEMNFPEIASVWIIELREEQVERAGSIVN